MTKKFIKNIVNHKEPDYPEGFFSAGFSSGLKKKTTADTAVLYIPEGAVWSGVFSQNRFRSLSLDDAVSKKKKRIKLLHVFSGNANAATGTHQNQTITAVSEAASKLWKIDPEEFLSSYTGVVGRQFPYRKILPEYKKKAAPLYKSYLQKKTFPKNTLYNDPESKNKKLSEVKSFSEAILTTDTKTKRAATSLKLTGKTVKIAGCAKGSGMIYPNMATMLAYITTDMKMTHKDLTQIIKESTAESFNMISVDGDRSTNDSFMIFASGKSGIDFSKLTETDKKAFRLAVKSISQNLAEKIVKDGEGATKFIDIRVNGADSNRNAADVADAVAGSILVKTAVFGKDPNYGRILVAVGNAGVNINPASVQLKFGQHILYSKGSVKEKALPKAAAYLKKEKEIMIEVKLGDKEGHARRMTCDLSYDYVRINAEYTT